MLKKNEQIAIYIIVCLALTIYVITGISSVGYYHPDEHYQIIEFAGYKLWDFPDADLPWEFHSQIRATVQPYLCIGIFNILSFFGINNPYTLAMSLRLFASVSTFFAITFFIYSSRHLFKRCYLILYVLLSYLIWYIPFISSRFSSESLSGIFILLSVGFTLQLRDESKNLAGRFFLIGILSGFAFLFRFQSVAASIGLMGFLLFVKRHNLKHLALCLIGAVLIVHLGALMDYFFYGNFGYTFISYFRENVVEGVASSFGVSPWYFYLTEGSRSAFFPIGLMIILALAVLLLYEKDNILLWIILPFIFLHSLIPHKEVRFMFPIASLTPALILCGYQKTLELLHSWRLKSFFTYLVYPLIFCNIVCIMTCALIPAGNGSKAVTLFIDREYKNKETTLNHTFSSNPYNPYRDIRENFYLNNSVKFNYINTQSPVNTISVGSDVNLLVIKKKDLASSNLKKFITTYKYEKIFQSIPEWALELKKLSGYSGDGSTLIVYYSKFN